MEYEIFGDNLPAVTINLETGESIYTQSGGMSWMTDSISMETNTKGGLLKGLGRMLAGDSLFMVTYTAKAPNQSITLASSFPGEIAALNVSEKSYICQKSAFLCAEPSVNLSIEFSKKISAGLFGGEGFILQKISGNGMAFLELDGSLKEIYLSPGEKIIVDTGSIAYFESSVTYAVETVKGFKNILFGGEGLFLTTLTGPGKVCLQTLSVPSLAQRLIPYIPVQRSN